MTAFNEVRDFRDDLFKQYLGEAVDMEPLRSSTSFLAESFAENVSWPVLCVTAFFVTSAQTSTLILFVRTYGPQIPSLATLAVSAVILGFLYWLFWRGQKRQRANLMIRWCLPFSAVELLALIVFTR